MHLLPIDREILRIACPAIATNITVPLLGLVDVAIVGHIGNARYIGAIAIGTMMFNVIYWLFAFLRMGTSGLTAQAYGAGNIAECHRMLRESVTIAMTLALILLIIQYPIRRMAYLLFDPPATMIPLINTYYDICIWGMPAMLSLYAMSGWLIGMQNTRATMAIAVSQNIINIALSLMFVFVLHMDIAGIALGTVLAKWAGTIIAVLSVRRETELKRKKTNTRKNNEQHPVGQAIVRESNNNPLNTYDDTTVKSQNQPHPAPHIPHPYITEINSTKLTHTAPPATKLHPSLKSLFKPYLSIFLRTLFLVLVNTCFVAYGTSMGEQTLAVNTLLMQLFMLFSYIMDGFAYSGEALGGKYLGAGNPLRLKMTVHRLFRWGLGAMLIFTIAYAFGAQTFLTLLTHDNNLITAAHPYLAWIIAVPCAGMAAFVWDGIFIGTTKTWSMLIATITAAACFFAMWLLCNSRWGNHALWLAFITFLVMRSVVQTYLWTKNNPTIKNKTAKNIHMHDKHKIYNK